LIWRVVIAVLFVGGVAAACHDPDVYVYTARRYDPAQKCLDPYTAIDQMNGTSVSSKCLPNCFELKNDVYTSHVCPPLPLEAVPLDAEAPECKAAIAAYAHTCGADAGDAGGGDDDDDASVLDAGDGGG
jgi:hypothetical protein